MDDRGNWQNINVCRSKKRPGHLYAQVRRLGRGKGGRGGEGREGKGREGK
jgi:hypothetical protein